MEKQEKIGKFESAVSQKRKDNQIDERIEIDIEQIEINHQNKPLVICYGPVGIGKTVTILRLISYIESKFTIAPVTNFKSNDNDETIEKFNEIRRNFIKAPDANGNVNFLLLDVNHSNSGKSFCNILEAPGEHFFKTETEDDGTYPNYLNRIIATQNYRKIYVFFFAKGMLENQRKRKSYGDKISTLIRTRIDPKKDKVIILLNKCDKNPQAFRNGKPVEEEFRQQFYNDISFAGLKDLLKNNGFSNIPVIAFSSGDYTTDSKGDKTIAPSADHYPKLLWESIHDAVIGRRVVWWNFFSQS